MLQKSKPLVEIEASEFETHARKVSDAIRDVFGFELRQNQIDTSRGLLTRSIVELATGEGKTVAAAIAISVLADHRKREASDQTKHCGILVATANDYLAQRDARAMQSIFQRQGFSCGCVLASCNSDARRTAYAADIVYGTMREFGFDFLRDSIAARESPSHAPVQRAPWALVIDEADSLLIDEARTPLIISGPKPAASPAAEACFAWCAASAAAFQEGEDFVRMQGSGGTAFTKRGRAKVYGMSMPKAMKSLTLTEVLHALERAIYVQHHFARDQHYRIEDGRVLIVDEYTGRVAEGRTWSGGIHQAIEAREGLPLTAETEAQAEITIQDYASRFPRLCGMTGTAQESHRELKTLYDLDVTQIETHRPSRRTTQEDLAFAKHHEKAEAIADEAQRMIDASRAVLIGTRTIRQSNALADVLNTRGLKPVVLSAANPHEEAQIIGDAGRSGALTVATNMAGRGTDIQLDQPCSEAGGLHVIASELHAASRIDRQLAGRGARCGDPGSFRQFMSLEDEILTLTYGSEEACRIANRLASATSAKQAAELRKAQRKLELRHAEDRLALATRAEHLNVMYRSLGLSPILDRFNS